LNLAPVFFKIPNASSLFEIRDGINAIGYIQLLGNNWCQGSIGNIYNEFENITWTPSCILH